MRWERHSDRIFKKIEHSVKIGMFLAARGLADRQFLIPSVVRGAMRLAVLEDDPSELDVLVRVLATAGYTCHAFQEGNVLMKHLQRETFDLLVLDWRVPDMSGEEVLNWARSNPEKHRVPIIFVTARDDEAGIAHILNGGADDYVIKPVSAPILCARVGALLRRTYSFNDEVTTYQFDRYRFEVSTNLAYIDDKQVALTRKEFELALTLFQHVNRPLSRDHILDLIWRGATHVSSRTMDTHISMIRTKLGLRRENGYRVIPIYGYGYRLESIGE